MKNSITSNKRQSQQKTQLKNIHNKPQVYVHNINNPQLKIKEKQEREVKKVLLKIIVFQRSLLTSIT